MTDKMSVPIPVLLAHPTRDTPGDAVRWRVGQRAVFWGCSGKHDVVVTSDGFVGHEAVPGELCVEVLFEDGSGAGCVLARKLRLRW
jgi:hypothetical protein